MNEATKANFHDPIFERRRPTVLQPRAAIEGKESLRSFSPSFSAHVVKSHTLSVFLSPLSIF